MGYEIKVYIGNISKIAELDSENKAYFMPLAMVDLHKPGYDSQIYALATDKQERERVYFYAGNTRVTEDKYGNKLSAYSIKGVTAALKKDKKSDYPYFKIALDLINAYKNELAERWDYRVVLFGY